MVRVAEQDAMTGIVLVHRVATRGRESANDLSRAMVAHDALSNALVAHGAIQQGGLGSLTAWFVELEHVANVLSALRVHGAHMVIAATAAKVQDRTERTTLALEHAIALVGRGQPGELIMDARVREHLHTKVSSIRPASRTGGARAYVVALEPHDPGESEELTALAVRGLPQSTHRLLEPFVDALLEKEPRFLAIKGPSGAGFSELVNAALEYVRPRWILRPLAMPGFAAPLLSLAAALRRQGSMSRAALLESADAQAIEVFHEVELGALVERERLINALQRVATSGPEADLDGTRVSRPWIVFDPIRGVDAATLEVLAQVASRGFIQLIARQEPGGALPSTLSPLAQTSFSLPVLRLVDARVVAKGILGDNAAPEVIRRVAILGGDTTLGILEVSRLLVERGVLLRDTGGFVFANAAPEGVNALLLERVVEERFNMLSSSAQQILQIVAALPTHVEREVVIKVAALDGLGSSEAAFSNSSGADGWFMKRLRNTPTCRQMVEDNGCL